MIRVITLGLGLLLLAACGTQTSVKCTAANCSGCCTDMGECLGSTKQSRNACGTMGAECRVCLPDQLCGAGRCQKDPDASVVLDDGGTISITDSGVPDAGPPPCGQQGQTCCTNMGCFLGLTCQRGVCDVIQAADAGPCGSQGQACCANQMCTQASTVCSSGTCTLVSTPDGGSDAGALRPTGAACTLDAQCLDGTCLQIGFSGGYCTKACTTSANCIAGSQCGTNSSGVGPVKVCLTQCTMPGQAPGGCRTDYVCERNVGTSGVPVCFPKCTSNTTCAAPTCDSRGFCCGTPGSVCCEGSMCEPGNTCMSGQCVAGGTGGGGGATGGGGGATGGGGGATGGGGGTTGGGGATGGGSSGGGGGSTGGGGGFGQNLPTGSACTDWLQCEGDSCLVSGWPGGYCTNLCNSSSCPAGSSCGKYSAGFPVGNIYCLKNCAWDGGRGDCRTGYICDRYLVEGTDTATCTLPCPTVSCATNTTCENGFCCGKPYFRCCAGGACPGGGTCRANGYCQ